MSDAADLAVFSEEEQRHITDEIERAARREALSPPSLPSKSEAARKGLFPLMVNIGALALLAAGAFLLFYFQNDESRSIRESGGGLGITERALIREIRRETNRLLGEKEAAIDRMNGELAAVDAELARLDSLEALTGEQRRTMEDLRRQQEEYHAGLSAAQAERARIIGESRRQEERLRERLLEQENALENLSGRSREEISRARDELAKLSLEHDKASLIEQQVTAYFTLAGEYGSGGRYREALETLAALREFLATPAFAELRGFKARRESDLAAAGAMTALVTGALVSAPDKPPSAAQDAAAQTNNIDNTAAVNAAEAAQLRRQLAENAASLDAREAMLADLQKSLAEAQAAAAARERTIAERDRQLESLRAQNAANLETMESQLRTIAALNAELEKRP
jgi:flagellar basal body-associated protein FliL